MSLVDKIVCLGDTVQSGPQPSETVKRLRSIDCPIVMGNADNWLLAEDSDPKEPTSKEQLEVREWTISKLGAADLEFLRSYQSTVKIALDNNNTLLCFHGSPLSYDDVLLPTTPQEEWDRLLGSYSPAIMTGGHTHTQQMRRVGDGLFFNPGSIGFVSNYLLSTERHKLDPWAEYAILSCDHGRLHLEFRRVPFDEKRLLSIIGTSGRPHARQYMSQYGDVI